MGTEVDPELLRRLSPVVLSVLVRRGADFATAEDAVQEALLKALSAWPDVAPRDPKAWLITVAWRSFIDRARSDSARRAREDLVNDEPPPGPTEQADDTLRLYGLCAHPSLTPSSAIALTRRAARWAPDERLIPLADQDREQWDRELIAEGVVILQAALARHQLGPYQAQAAIAALHADAARVEETDWVQIASWYDELLGFGDPSIPRWSAVAAHLHERNGDLERAAELYARAARDAPNLAERDHQTRQAARVNAVLRGR